MDKIKKALGFGDFGDYQHDIERMRREHEEHLKRVEYDQQRRMNMAQGVYNQEKYGYGWNDPRAARLTGATPISPEEALVDSIAQTNLSLRLMADRLEKQERRVEMLSGFYTWITEVYPEIAAQHKAMRDLYEAANAPQQNQTEAGPEASS